MAQKLKALTDLFLRRSPDPADPRYQEWYRWNTGEVFTPPAHLRIDQALKRGIVEWVKEES